MTNISGFNFFFFCNDTFPPFPCHILRGALNKSQSVYSPATTVAVVLMTTSIMKVTPQPSLERPQLQINCSLSFSERYLISCKLEVEISLILEDFSVVFLTSS